MAESFAIEVGVVGDGDYACPCINGKDAAAVTRGNGINKCIVSVNVGCDDSVDDGGVDGIFVDVEGGVVGDGCELVNIIDIV